MSTLRILLATFAVALGVASVLAVTTTVAPTPTQAACDGGNRDANRGC